MTGLLLKTSLVLLIGLGVNTFLARSTAGTRHLVLTATLAGVLILPLLALWVPTLTLAWLPAKTLEAPVAEMGTASSPSPGGTAANDGKQPREVVSTAPEPVTAPSDAAALFSGSTGAQWQTVAIAVYILGVIVILAGPLVGVFQLWRIRRGIDARPDGQGWGGLIEGLDVVPAISRRVIVACSSAVPVPMTWGVLRPVVLLPLEAENWPAEQRRQALLHELSHVRRLDWFVQMLARLVCALYWFHPLIWIAKRRLHLEAERACDDNVLMAGARSSLYADQLLDLARRINLPRLSTFGAVTLARRHQLWVRIDSILDKTVRRSPMTLTRTFSVALVTLATLLVVASLSVVPAGQGARESDDSKRTLMSAVARGSLDDVRAMLDSGADADGGLKGQGTPLILAARSGNMEMVRLLLSRGADVNRAASPLDRGDPSRTALTSASSGGHLDMVSLLLDEGAEVDAAPPGDPTALMAAADRSHEEVVDLLIEHGANVNRVVRGDGTPLIAAARSGNSDVIEQLLERGADPNQWVTGDENALFHSIRSGDADAVRTLIDAGVRVNDVWPGDGTPLMVAARDGNDEVIELLLTAGAEPNRDVDGDGNALIVASRGGNYDAVLGMLNAGADVNRGVEGDGNALILAARGGYLDVVELLLDNGAEVDRVVPGDENALIQASWQGHLDVVELLVDAGADVNLRVRSDGQIRTALSQARRSGHGEVVDFLMENGAHE